MLDLLKIVLEKKDHWSLIILFLCIVILGLMKTPLLSGLLRTDGYKVFLNILWGAIGIAAFYILIILVRDYSKDQNELERVKSEHQKEIDIIRIKANLELIKRKPELVSSDSSLTSLFTQVSNTVFSGYTKTDHPITDKTLDQSKCWIKTNHGTNLLRRPKIFNEEVIATEIPIAIYYVLDKTRERQFNELFFKIRLSNGLEGWVRDLHLGDKNPVCYN